MTVSPLLYGLLKVGIQFQIFFTFEILSKIPKKLANPFYTSTKFNLLKMPVDLVRAQKS